MSIKSKIQSLISAANAKTGESDATLTDAVQTLVDGYGQGGGGYQTPYQLGGYYGTASYKVDIVGNHVRAEALSNAGPISIGLRMIPQTNISTWFTINAGDTVSIVYSNVVNESNVGWNANFKQANTTTSLQYGIGNDTHLNGATVTAIPTSAQDIGCLFIYVDRLFVDGSVLEFDVEIYVNGVRYV